MGDENTTATTTAEPELTDAQIIAALEAADKGGGAVDFDSVKPAGEHVPAPDGEAGGKGAKGGEGNEPKKPDAEGQPGDKKPEDAGGGDNPLADEDELAEKPDDSNYTKAKKDAARLDRSWKTLNAEKEALARQKAELEEFKKSLSQPPPKPAGQPKPQGEEKLTAGDYLQAAELYDKEGKADEARACRNLAAQAQQSEKIETQQREQQFKDEWNKNLATIANSEGYQDLKKLDSPLAKNMLKVLQVEGDLLLRPDGCKKAAWVAKILTVSEEVPGLKSKVAEQEKEIERLRKLVKVDPTPAPTTKKDDAAKGGGESEADLLAHLKELDESAGR